MVRIERFQPAMLYSNVFRTEIKSVRSLGTLVNRKLRSVITKPAVHLGADLHPPNPSQCWCFFWMPAGAGTPWPDAHPSRFAPCIKEFRFSDPMARLMLTWQSPQPRITNNGWNTIFGSSTWGKTKRCWFGTILCGHARQIGPIDLIVRSHVKIVPSVWYQNFLLKKWATGTLLTLDHVNHHYLSPAPSVYLSLLWEARKK